MTPITTQAEADQALAQLARDQAELAAAELELERELLMVRERHRVRLSGLAERVARQADELLDYGARLAEGGQTLSHGTIRVLRTASHVEHDLDDEQLCRTLSETRPGLLRWETTLDRQLVRRLPTEELARLGFRLVARRSVELKLITGSVYKRELP